AVHPYTRLLLESVPTAHLDADQQEQGVPSALSAELPSPLDPPSGCRFRTRCPLATELCAEREPELRPAGDGHYVACHHAEVVAQRPPVATGLVEAGA